MQPIPGQFKDMDNLRYCKLPYYGAKTDNMNSVETALMDRLRFYQYLYDILGYRFDLLAATDKGKKVLMNVNMIPNSAGMDIKKWQYFMESSPYMWYDPSEEGANGYNDANTVAKVIDLSYAGQMNQYIEMMEYIRIQCGKSVGITDQVEGAIGVNEKVANVQQSMTQTSHILEPYFELHNTIKKNVLQALIEASKIAYSNGNQKKLVYFLDDMSTEIINLDMGLLESSTLNLFLSNSARTDAIKTTIEQLTHAALQNQKVELSDVIAVMRQDSIIEAEEILKVAEEKRETRLNQSQQEQSKSVAEEAEKQREFIRETREHEKQIVVLKEEQKRETIIIESSLMGASFNPDLDKDDDGINDFIEIAKHGLDAEVKRQNVQLQKDKFEHQKVVDDKKIQQQDKKLALDKIKLNAK
jgi:flagellar motor protein MotB